MRISPRVCTLVLIILSVVQKVRVTDQKMERGYWKKAGYNQL